MGGNETEFEAQQKAGTLCLACGDIDVFQTNPGRCSRCASPRRIAHEELLSLSIAHIDCDAFYAAVEKRDRPELASQPVIIGGGMRGVVSTACYIARTYGIKSAMPMFKAKKLCPQAVVLKPDMKKYVTVSKALRDKMLSLTPAVEPLSIDEAFLDLSGTERLHGSAPAPLLARLSREVERDLGISVSVGLAPNKFLAKLASDLEKPHGFTVIGRAEAKDRLAPLPVSVIWGVGKHMRARLAKDGITHVRDLVDLPPDEALRRYGQIGTRLVALANAKDQRVVKPSRQRKSVSSERTFSQDIRDGEVLSAKAWTIAEKVSLDLKTKGLKGRTITLKLKTAQFRLMTRSHTRSTATDQAHEIFAEVETLLTPLLGKNAYRLLGVGVSGLSDCEHAHVDDQFLLEPEKNMDERNTGRAIKTEAAIDALRGRFGGDIIKKGRSLKDR